MTYRNLSIQELKTNYSDRPGFVFISSVPSSRVSCERLCLQIKESDICKYEPDFINELEQSRIIAFVYPEGVNFDSGDFYRYADPELNSGMMRFLGLFKVDSLAAFLKDN
jgi:hypothetical protein